MKKWLLLAVALLLALALALVILLSFGALETADYHMRRLPAPDADTTLVLAGRVSSCEYMAEPEAQTPDFTSQSARRVAFCDWCVTEVFLGDPLLVGQTITIREVQGRADSLRLAGQGWRFRRAALEKPERILAELDLRADGSASLRALADVAENGAITSLNWPSGTTLDEVCSAPWQRNVFYLRLGGDLYRLDGATDAPDTPGRAVHFSFCDEPLPSEDGTSNWNHAPQITRICVVAGALLTYSGRADAQTGSHWLRWERVDQGCGRSGSSAT